MTEEIVLMHLGERFHCPDDPVRARQRSGDPLVFFLEIFGEDPSPALLTKLSDPCVLYKPISKVGFEHIGEFQIVIDPRTGDAAEIISISFIGDGPNRLKIEEHSFGGSLSGSGMVYFYEWNGVEWEYVDSQLLYMS